MKNMVCSICWDRESKGIESRRTENINHGVNQLTKDILLIKCFT